MRTILLVATLALAACSAGPDRAAMLNALVGQPATEVVRQLGVPSRTYQTAGHSFLAYTEQRSEIVSGGPFLFGGGFGGGGYRGGGFGGFGGGFGYDGFPTEITPRLCETTFDLVNERVVGWALHGNACD